MQKISKEDWIWTIDKELKAKDWKDVFIALTEEINVPPAYHLDGIGDQVWTPIETFRNFDPNLGLSLDLSDSKKGNERLLQILNHGVDAPRVVVSENWNGNVEQFYKEVHLDWLTWFIDDTSGVLQDHLNAQKAVHYWSLSARDIIGGDISEIMDSFTDQLYQWSREEVKASPVFTVKISENYFNTIVLLRAMRRMHRNYSEALGLDHQPFYLNVEIDPELSFDTEENRLIALSTMAMSAMIAGADRIGFSPSQSEDHQEFYDRIAINIVHILKMESNFNRVQDLFCGSFWVEKSTDLLASTYWKKLQER